MLQPAENVARQALSRMKSKPHPGSDSWVIAVASIAKEVEADRAATRREALLEAAKVLHAEAELFIENGRRCDASGNTYGGSSDAGSAATCQRMAAALTRLAEQPAGRGR